MTDGGVMYTEKELVGIAKRENNNKRKYLVVNTRQGKHVPVSPKMALDMFRELGSSIREEYKNEKVLVVGFAETATAIGAALAIELESAYIQTTREIIEDVEYLFFSEEHSHATEQKLVKDDIESIIFDIDRIIFAEDEVTTGKTIMNIISILDKLYPDTVKYSVASILNGMDESAMGLYKKKSIKLHYLVKTSHSEYDTIADSFAGDGKYHDCNTDEYNGEIKQLKLSSMMNTRRLTDTAEYQKWCDQLYSKLEVYIDEKVKNALVIGTEEFMYPAIYVAKCIEEKGVLVKTHSTTRSPIAVSGEDNYPLHERFELKSMYDKNRVIYIYDLQQYDLVFIISDSENKYKEGINSLLNALNIEKNRNIILICSE